MKRAVFAIALMMALSPVAGSADLGEIVRSAAARNHISPSLLHGVIMVESSGNCRAYNHYGHAYGLGQVQRRTAASVGVRGNLFDCRVGAEAAARYLRLAMTRARSACAAASLYNMGVWARPRCTAYGRKVLRLASE
jgi:soluble lytic murein transglycosylase-like protein